MKLLIVTQMVDTEDPVLGFFVVWLAAFAQRFERIEVICLQEGKHNLPRNVHVHSLGKERGRRSRLVYTLRFLTLVWRLRHDYEAVLVHMNEEYILIAGWFWRLFGKRIYLWRNHYAGSSLTDLAALFCTKIFFTSQYSYTAKYGKTTTMPVGIDLTRFVVDERVPRTPRSILFLSRMAPSKRPELLVDALALLAHEGVGFTADFYGSPLPKDEAYYEGLKEKVRALDLIDRITFHSGIPNSQTPDLYRAHEIFVNTSPSGMLDKTIFEAAASGCLVLASSEDVRRNVGEEFTFEDATALAKQLKVFLESSGEERARLSSTLKRAAEKNSLDALSLALTEQCR